MKKQRVITWGKLSVENLQSREEVGVEARRGALGARKNLLDIVWS